MAACQETEDTPTSAPHVRWLYEHRRENIERNVYPPNESGKWMMFYGVQYIDQAWSRAKELYRSGQLPDVNSMKVSTVMPVEEYSPDQKVLIFYCGPASDKDKMLAIGRDLVKKMAYNRKQISYKTDAQTIQGIRGSTYTLKLS